MTYRSIADIYETNEKIHGKLCALLSGIETSQANNISDGEKWSIAQIVEHISLVETGVQRICSKLLSKAEQNGQLSDGAELDMADFLLRTEGIADVKLEAPEVVQPNKGRSIPESLELLAANEISVTELRPMFEKFDGNAQKFPHPYLGDLSAVEWLALAGGHKIRHIRQIQRRLEKFSAAG